MDYITPFLQWLLKSDYIKNNRLFLNAVEAKDDNIQIITQQIARNQTKKYVDGSKSYPMTFHIANYKSVSFDQLVKTALDGNENVSALLEVGQVIDFVERMDEKKDYPNFGENILVERVYCNYTSPSTPTIDSSVSPALAKFTIPIVCEVTEYV